MKMRRILAILLVLMLAASSLAGCNQAGEQNNTLNVAAIETSYGTESWKAVCEAFEKANEGVTVNLTINKQLEDSIGPNMKAGDYPDVVHLAVGREAALTETMIKENGLLDLTDVLGMTNPGESKTVKEKILPSFIETSITNPYSDGKTYLAPMFYGPCGLFYNAGLFEEKGWKVPETWDEMWELGEKAKAEGIALFTYPTTGYFDAFFYALLYEAGGDEFFKKATQYSEGIWDTDEAKEVFDIITKLASYTEKSTPSNATDTTYLKNQTLICENKALFMPNGNWVIGEMKDVPKADNFEWGFTALPAMEAGGDRYSYTFFEQCWIPKEAKNPELAKKFVAFLYSDEAIKIFAESEKPAVQPVQGVADTLTDENMKLYYSIYDNGAKAAVGAFATTDPVEGVDVRSVWFDPINSLVSGDKTQQEWVDGIKQASDTLRGALK